MKRAFITGITGQDGSYLAESLLADGYEVRGTTRQPTSVRFPSDYLTKAAEAGHLRVHTNQASFIIKEWQPDEIYHLAAQSSPSASFDRATESARSCIEIVEILEAVKNFTPAAKVFVAGSFDMFGNAEEYDAYNDSKDNRDERSPVEPISPYGASKLFAAQMTRIYREQGVKACVGILGPHESPRRPDRFVTRKITKAAARIELGLQETLHLGNTSAVRCWFHAKDAVRAMRLLIEKIDEFEPGDVRTFDYVIGNSNAHTVAEFAEKAFEAAGLDWRNCTVVDETLVRAHDITAMRCDPSAIKYDLGWEPSISFESLIEEMVANDIEIAKKEGWA